MNNMEKDLGIVSKMNTRLEKLAEQFDARIGEGNEKAADLIERKMNALEDDILNEEIKLKQNKRKKTESLVLTEKPDAKVEEDEDCCPECGGDLYENEYGYLYCPNCQQFYEVV